MKDHRLKSYMRTFRRRTGFTQSELAFLIGCSSGTQISRYERLRREPPFHVFAAYIIISQMSGYELYPAYFQDMEGQVGARARELYDELQGSPSPQNNTKLDALEELLARTEKPNQRLS